MSSKWMFLDGNKSNSMQPWIPIDSDPNLQARKSTEIKPSQQISFTPSGGNVWYPQVTSAVSNNPIDSYQLEKKVNWVTVPTSTLTNPTIDARISDQQVWYPAPTSTFTAPVDTIHTTQQAWLPITTTTTVAAPPVQNISYQPSQTALPLAEVQTVPQFVQTPAPIGVYTPHTQIADAPQASFTPAVVNALYQTHAIPVQQPAYTYLGETYTQPAAAVHAQPAVQYDHAPTPARGARPDGKSLWEFLPLIPTLQPGQTVSDFEAAHRHFYRKCAEANARPKPNSDVEAGLSKILGGKNIFEQSHSHGLFRGQNIFDL